MVQDSARALLKRAVSEQLFGYGVYPRISAGAWIDPNRTDDRLPALVTIIRNLARDVPVSEFGNLAQIEWECPDIPISESQWKVLQAILTQGRKRSIDLAALYALSHLADWKASLDVIEAIFHEDPPAQTITARRRTIAAYTTSREMLFPSRLDPTEYARYLVDRFDGDREPIQRILSRADDPIWYAACTNLFASTVLDTLNRMHIWAVLEMECHPYVAQVALANAHSVVERFEHLSRRHPLTQALRTTWEWESELVRDLPEGVDGSAKKILVEYAITHHNILNTHRWEVEHATLYDAVPER